MTPPTNATKEIVPVNIEDEMRQSYLDYSMSVIIGRALPDVRDGLKPVHRRILYAMYREGLLSSKRYSKCAGVVGEVLKKYHPHGDIAVYDTLVRLAQPWNMRYPLIDGQGNFGSIDGDSAAAYRYTECKLTALAEEIMSDIDKNTVDFALNFDNSTTEPLVLPTKIPNLVINGSDGIAVGMATKIPPHNLTEITQALFRLIDDPDLADAELFKIVTGPDFPTAGSIYGCAGIRNAYKTGRGKLTIRAKIDIEPLGKGSEREAIVVSEIPYQVSKTKIMESIGDLVNQGKIDGIGDLRDESNREGIRIVIELKKGSISNVVLNQLYKHTALQSSFGIIMLAIVDGQPKTMGLKQLLQLFLKHRKEVVIRRTAFELKQAQERAHILEGLKIALENIDEVVALIKKSKNPLEAKFALIKKFELSDVQAQAILDMRLQRLTGLECDKIIAEYKEVLELIKKLKEILGNETLVLKIIKEELSDIQKKYGDARRTQIAEGDVGEIDIEDLIQKEEMAVTVSHQGYIKRTPVSAYRAQRRGGKGKQGMATREEDFVVRIFTASTHDIMLIFTSKGRVYWLKVYEIPEASRIAKGKSLSGLIQLENGERVAAILPIEKFSDDELVLFITKSGTVKKTALSAYSNPRAGGIIAITLKDDELVQVRSVKAGQDVIISTAQGLAIRFDESDVRAMGRSAAGVHGIRFKRKGDHVVGMDVAEAGKTILTVSTKGYGKKTELSEYRKQSRGGSGIITLKVTTKTGPVLTATQCSDQDDLMLISNKGKIIRQRINDISVLGRNTQGVRLMDMEEGEAVVSATVIEPEEDEESS